MQNLNKWQKLFNPPFTTLQRLENFNHVEISIKRDDLNHPYVQGNKLRKLKYNIKSALDQNTKTVVTFGGAWSNHIVATARAAALCGMKSIGFIRGDELENQNHKWSAALKQAADDNMQFIFLNRQDYRQKICARAVKTVLQKLSEKPYYIPEGGSNTLAIKGIIEIIDELKQQTSIPDYIVSACGTGGTLAGLIDGVAKHKWHTKVIGISVLKGAEYLIDEVKKLSQYQHKIDWCLTTNYHAGGYAKINEPTQIFARDFMSKHNIPLDKVYTSKAFFAAYDLIIKGKIKKNSHVVILHTGGLQGGVIL